MQKGRVTPDAMLHRHGRRYERLDGKGICKNKPRARQRIATAQEAPLIHVDAVEAREMLRKFHVDALEHAVDELDDDFGQCQGPEEDPIPPPAEPPPLPPGWVVVSEDET